MPNTSSSLLLLSLLFALLAPVLTAESSERSKVKDGVEAIRLDLQNMDLLLKTVSTALVTVNSYTAAITNTLKDYKVFEVMSVLESIGAFFLSIRHLLTVLFASLFFALAIDSEDQEGRSGSPRGSYEAVEMADS